MCAHNGTHVDAPFHFIDDGKKIDEVDLNKFVGYAYVTEHEGDINAAPINLGGADGAPCRAILMSL